MAKNDIKAIEEMGIEFGEEIGQSNEDLFDLPNYKVELSDLDDGDTYTGKPILCEPNSFTFKDKVTGEEQTRHQTALYLVDREGDEYLEIKINLKQEGLIQEKVYPSSKLYPLLKGCAEMKYGAGVLFDEKKVIKKINLKTIIGYCEEFPVMTIKVVEKTGKFNYNTFVVIEPEE